MLLNTPHHSPLNGTHGLVILSASEESPFDSAGISLTLFNTKGLLLIDKTLLCSLSPAVIEKKYI
jgi:hypothetical protein